jgi:hypothetical protein
MITTKDRERALQEANKVFGRRFEKDDNYVSIFLLIILCIWVAVAIIW